MKYFIYSTIILSILCIATNSCSKNDDVQQTQEIPDKTYLKVSDIKGVWTNGDNNLYFISLNSNGRYSFCFNDRLMGAGTYLFDKDTLLLNNGYLYTTDTLFVIIKDTILNINGYIQNFKQVSREKINLSYCKTNEEFSVSKVGEKYSTSFLALTGYAKDIIQYQTDYIAKYQRVKDNSIQQLIKEEYWFYIFRNGMTYTQKCTETGSVIIYLFSNEHRLGAISDKIVKQ